MNKITPRFFSPEKSNNSGGIKNDNNNFVFAHLFNTFRVELNQFAWWVGLRGGRGTIFITAISSPVVPPIRLLLRRKLNLFFVIWQLLLETKSGKTFNLATKQVFFKRGVEIKKSNYLRNENNAVVVIYLNFQMRRGMRLNIIWFEEVLRFVKYCLACEEYLWFKSWGNLPNK